MRCNKMDEFPFILGIQLCGLFAYIAAGAGNAFIPWMTRYGAGFTERFEQHLPPAAPAFCKCCKYLCPFPLLFRQLRNSLFILRAPKQYSLGRVAVSPAASGFLYIRFGSR